VTSSKTKVSLLAGFALVGFAANSLLCRAALRGGSIDAGAFTAVRLVTGALALQGLLVARAKSASRRQAEGGWVSGALLFAYAAAFSFAYLELPAGVGALLLFGCVQVTMIAGGVVRGERPSPLALAGVALALGGLMILTRPWSTLHAARGAGLVPTLAMVVAGVAWGLYSLRGRGLTDPLAATAKNFACAVPFAALLPLWLGARHVVTVRGITLASISGAITSGIAYSVWYAALAGLSATQAAAAQLLVPILAAASGVVFLGEEATARLAAAATTIVGGVGLAIASRARRT
jgi:drug/metabolite transporter (DMT)-like permease